MGQVNLVNRHARAEQRRQIFAEREHQGERGVELSAIAIQRAGVWLLVVRGAGGLEAQISLQVR
jgi:hypothetical protein